MSMRARAASVHVDQAAKLEDEGPQHLELYPDLIDAKDNYNHE
jgi:hypothetical protein